MPQIVTIVCAQCGVETDKQKKEYDRQVRNGRDPEKFFCSGSCATKHSMAADTHSRVKYLRPQHRNNHNRKGSFTYYLNKARNRRRRNWSESNLTEEYLQAVWDMQGGKCAWTGLPMILVHKGAAVDYFASASLDRISSEDGYVMGNVQFVLLPLNHAKKDADDDDFLRFLSEVAESLRG